MGYRRRASGHPNGGASQPTRLSDADQQILQANEHLHGAYQGQRCFILACGPSVALEDLSPLDNHLCIGVSQFYLHEQFAHIAPEFHCFTPWHPPLSESDWVAAAHNIPSNQSPHTKLVFGLADFDRVSIPNQLGKSQHFLGVGRSSQFPTTDVDLCSALPGPQSVPIMAMLLALGLGCTEIALVGTDFSYLSHYGESQHFYAEEDSPLHSDSHSEWDGSTVYDELRNLTHLWSQFFAIRKLAEDLNVRVYNTSQKSLLDVFPRCKLSSLV